MITFCKDVDIARFEPALFDELSLPNQVLAEGTAGQISGTTFSDAAADFDEVGIEAGDVIYVKTSDGTKKWLYEVVSVDSATQLTISVIRAEGSEVVVAPQAGGSLTWRISTLEPQSAEAAIRICRMFGIRPGNPDSQYSAEDIVDKEGLRQAAVFMVLAIVYASLVSGSDSENMRNKNLYYEKECCKALENCRFSIDVDEDGEGDVNFSGGSIKLVRE
jgi:hypothetical protein